MFEWEHSTTDGGSGSGLAIVSDLVEVHDWTVTVTGNDAGGAGFEIEGIDTAEAPPDRDPISQ